MSWLLVALGRSWRKVLTAEQLFQRPAAVGGGLDHLAACAPLGAQRGQLAQQGVVGGPVAEFVGIGHVHAGADRRHAGAGTDDDEIAAGVAAGKVPT